MSTDKAALPLEDGPAKTRPAFDRRALSYAASFDNPMKSHIIRAIEWCTGKLSIVRMIRQFERGGPYDGQAFWTAALAVLGVDIRTPVSQIENIPATGPVVFVANHPHGMVDGMVMAELIGRRRTDYKVLTRSLLTSLDTTASQFLIPVPFPHQHDAQEQMVKMRAEAMAHLAAGGVVAVFPSGVVASSDSLFGPAIEREWNAFTAKMIRKSGATVVPCFFPGSNSRWYQMANRLSATLRQSLLIHEIVRSRNQVFSPIIGTAQSQDDMRKHIDDQRGFMAWLRATTLALGKSRP